MIAQHAMKLRPSTNVLGLFIKFFQKKKRPQNATFFTFLEKKQRYLLVFEGLCNFVSDIHCVINVL